MQRRGLASVLEQHDFAKGLKPAHLKLIEGCAANVRIEAGKVLFNAGEPADRFYLVRDGKIRIEAPVTRRKTVVIRTAQPGEFVGWSWLVPPYRWHFTARAVETTLALSFDGKCLRGKLDKDHELGHELYRRFSIMMSRRMEEVLLQLVGVCG